MLKLFPLLLFCVACSPESGDHGDQAASPSRDFGTQTNPPSPNYSSLLKQPLAVVKRAQPRNAASPLPNDAKQIGDLWIARLGERGVLLGHGLAGKSPDGPVNMIDVGLTEAEFVKWTNDRGWKVPRHIRWSFVSEMNFPRVSDAAKNAIRIWPASTARTGPQYEALFQGRVELRDGCFFVGLFGQATDKLAWFHAEIGLDVDDSGYFILRDRVGGQTLARLGETMNWGGPASAAIDPESERALHQACGAGDIYVVGSPQASERFLVQYPHLRNPQNPPPPPPTLK